MRANKEARKREMEEMERMKAQMLEEEESIFFPQNKLKIKVTGGKREYIF